LGKNLFSDSDKKNFAQIEIITSTLQKHFPDVTMPEICDSLKKNSFNIIDTFKYLSEPVTYENLCFQDEDDYVIKNYRKSVFYKQLVEDKGKDRVEDRELFLNIDDF